MANKKTTSMTRENKKVKILLVFSTIPRHLERALVRGRVRDPAGNLLKAAG